MFGWACGLGVAFAIGVLLAATGIEIPRFFAPRPHPELAIPILVALTLPPQVPDVQAFQGLLGQQAVIEDFIVAQRLLANTNTREHGSGPRAAWTVTRRMPGVITCWGGSTRGWAKAARRSTSTAEPWSFSLTPGRQRKSLGGSPT